MSDTPRTNRVTRARSEIASTSVVDSDFARTLERELSASQAEVERLRNVLLGAEVSFGSAYEAAQGRRIDEVLLICGANEAIICRALLDNPAEPGAKVSESNTSK